MDIHPSIETLVIQHGCLNMVDVLHVNLITKKLISEKCNKQTHL